MLEQLMCVLCSLILREIYITPSQHTVLAANARSRNSLIFPAAALQNYVGVQLAPQTSLLESRLQSLPSQKQLPEVEIAFGSNKHVLFSAEYHLHSAPGRAICPLQVTVTGSGI